MTFLTKAQWGGRLATAKTSFGRKLGIAFHWEGPKVAIEHHDECVKKIRSIQSDHMEGRNSDKRPWNDIAYNLIACEHGYVFEGRGTNARSAANGATDPNEHYLAICYLGGEGDEMTVGGWAALREAVDIAVTSGFPRVGFPHSHFYATACPGDLIRKAIPDLIAGVVSKIPTLKEASEMISNPAADIELTATGLGYWILAEDGAVFAYGDATFHGGRGGNQTENAPFIAIRRTPTGEGYWIVGSDGGVFAYGDAPSLGSMGGEKLNEPIVGFSATDSGQGYVLLGSDGGIFAYGDAHFVGNARDELV